MPLNVNAGSNGVGVDPPAPTIELLSDPTILTTLITGSLVHPITLEKLTTGSLLITPANWFRGLDGALIAPRRLVLPVPLTGEFYFRLAPNPTHIPYLVAYEPDPADPRLLVQRVGDLRLALSWIVPSLPTVDISQLG
jgi:hypothetical protein